jgi:hypothetical protein
LAIAADEAKKAKRAAACELEAKDNEVAELQEVLAQRNAKLEEAQKAQADLIRKQRELDDAKRELDLTVVEKRVQASLAEVRQKAKNEADNELKLKVTEKEQQIASMQRQIEDLKRKAERTSQLRKLLFFNHLSLLILETRTDRRHLTGDKNRLTWFPFCSHIPMVTLFPLPSPSVRRNR